MLVKLIENGKIVVDGKTVLSNVGNNIRVVINGDVNKIDCCGSVEVHGNSGTIDCGGSCAVDGDVNGNIDVIEIKKPCLLNLSILNIPTAT